MAAILRHDYVLAVHEVHRSAAFYVEMLGFEVTADFPGWIFVSKEQCTIRLGECPDDMPAADTGCHSYLAYLQVDDADEYYQSLKAKGADLLSVVEDKPWGTREFGIRTPDGHRMMIAQELS